MTEGLDDWRVERIDPESDLDAVLAISADAFRQPLSRADLEAQVAQSDHTWILVVRPVAAGQAPGPVVGYCSAWRIFDELHINALAVGSEWRRRGAARRMLTVALDTAARLGATRATLEVRRSNTAARRLYESVGFTVRGTRRNYYSHPRDDALILWRAATLESPPAV